MGLQKKPIKKEYSNGEVTVTWEPDKCIHSTLCWKGLISVFNPKKRPWVNMEGASTEAIINQIKECPSGALGYYMDGEDNQEAESLSTTVEVRENGPLLVYGTLEVTHKDGQKEIRNKTTAFCRCGASQNKPFCDGSHVKAEFNG